MKRHLAYKLYHPANWVMDNVPIIGYSVGSWIKDRKIINIVWREYYD